MKYFKQFFRRHRGRAVLAAFLLLGQVMGTLLIPALIADVVDRGILRGNVDAILRTGVQMLVVAVLTSAVAAWGSWVTSDLSALFGREMRSKLLRKSQELSIQQFGAVGVSSMITRSTSDITNLQQTLGMMLQMAVPAPIIVAASTVMTAVVSPVMALIQVGFMAVLLIAAGVVLKKSNALSRSIQVRLDRINRVLREAITGARVIRAFGNEAYEEERSGGAYESYADNMIRLNKLFAVFIPVVWLLMGALIAVVLGIGGALTLGGTMEVGQITAVTEYSTLTMAYLIMAASAMTTLPKARACLDRLQELLDMQSAVADTAAAPAEPVHTAAVVEFDHVTFSYPGAEDPVLRDLSFTMYPGQTTAVIGSTGSGKSTLACSSGSTTWETAGFAWAAWMCGSSPKRSCAAQLAACPRRRFCSAAPLPTTCAWAAPTPPTGSCGRPCGWPRRRISSGGCPRGWAPRCPRGAPISPAGSGSGSPSPGPWSSGRTACCVRTACPAGV